MGRPKLDIDAEEVFKLAELGCKVSEIADFLECDRNTIYNRFSAELQKGRAGLRKSLRRWQIQAAESGNVVMLIWLGKQYLDQGEPSSDTKDQAEVEELYPPMTKDQAQALLDQKAKEKSEKLEAPK